MASAALRLDISIFKYGPSKIKDYLLIGKSIYSFFIPSSTLDDIITNYYDYFSKGLDEVSPFLRSDPLRKSVVILILDWTIIHLIMILMIYFE